MGGKGSGAKKQDKIDAEFLLKIHKTGVSISYIARESGVNYMILYNAIHGRTGTRLKNREKIEKFIERIKNGL